MPAQLIDRAMFCLPPTLPGIVSLQHRMPRSPSFPRRRDPTRASWSSGVRWAMRRGSYDILSHGRTSAAGGRPSVATGAQCLSTTGRKCVGVRIPARRRRILAHWGRCPEASSEGTREDGAPDGAARYGDSVVVAGAADADRRRGSHRLSRPGATMHCARPMASAIMTSERRAPSI